jgi:hypothetical protein
VSKSLVIDVREKDSGFRAGGDTTEPAFVGLVWVDQSAAVYPERSLAMLYMPLGSFCVPEGQKALDKDAVMEAQIVAPAENVLESLTAKNTSCMRSDLQPRPNTRQHLIEPFHQTSLPSGVAMPEGHKM